MNLPDFIEKLRDMSAQLATRGVRDSEVEVHVWDGEDTVPVTYVEWDVFEIDGPHVVMVAKRGDPGVPPTPPTHPAEGERHAHRFPGLVGPPHYAPDAPQPLDP